MSDITSEVNVVIDCGPDGKYVVSPAAKGIIDLASKKTTNAEISNFHEGDLVYAL